MMASGLDSVSKKSKKNLRRNIENEFGESIIFFIYNTGVFLMPEILSKETLAIECMRLKSELDKCKNAEKKPAVQVAISLLSRIGPPDYNIVW